MKSEGHSNLAFFWYECVYENLINNNSECFSSKNALVTDIVALIGDLTDGTVETSRGAAVVLQNINARIGKYFVSGM